MSGTNELDSGNERNGIGVINESITSAPTTSSDLNGHSESKGTSTMPTPMSTPTVTIAVAADQSPSAVTSTTSTSPSTPSNWVQFGNGIDNMDNVSSIIVFSFHFLTMQGAINIDSVLSRAGKSFPLVSPEHEFPNKKIVRKLRLNSDNSHTNTYSKL